MSDQAPRVEYEELTRSQVRTLAVLARVNLNRGNPLIAPVLAGQENLNHSSVWALYRRWVVDYVHALDEVSIRPEHVELAEQCRRKVEESHG